MIKKVYFWQAVESALHRYFILQSWPSHIFQHLYAAGLNIGSLSAAYLGYFSLIGYIVLTRLSGVTKMRQKLKFLCTENPMLAVSCLVPLQKDSAFASSPEIFVPAL